MKRTKKYIANMLVLCMIMSMFGFGSFDISYAEPVAAVPGEPTGVSAEAGDEQPTESLGDTEENGEEAITETSEEESSPSQPSEVKPDSETAVPETPTEEKTESGDTQTTENLGDTEENSEEATADTSEGESSTSEVSEVKPDEEATAPQAPTEEKTEAEDEQATENLADTEENGVEEEIKENSEEVIPEETVPEVMFKALSTPLATTNKTYITTEDNLNDDGNIDESDNDLGEKIINYDGDAQNIEFNIDVNGSLPETSAELLIRADDVDEEAGEKDKVYFNKTYIGTLSGSDKKWSTTRFDIPIADVEPRNNKITIIVCEGYSLTVDWGQLVIDGGSKELVLKSAEGNFDSSTNELNTKFTIEGTESDSKFTLELNLLDEYGNNIDVVKDTFTTTQEDLVIDTLEFTKVYNGKYTVRAYLFDSHSVMQSSNSFNISVHRENTNNWAEVAYEAIEGTDYTKEDSTYTISTPLGFAWVAKQVNIGNLEDDAIIELNKDIDLKAYEWTPIGGWSCYENDVDSAIMFKGKFNGNNHTISGLKMGQEDKSNTKFKYIGLFGIVYEDSEINDLNVKTEGIYTNFSNDTLYAGVLAGKNYGTIDNSNATGKVIAGDANNDKISIGGLVGRNEGAINSSSATGDVTAGNASKEEIRIGGLVGKNDGEIYNSYATGSASGGEGSYVGGFVGYSESIISNCYAVGDTEGEGLSVNGFVGRNEGTIEYAYYNSDAKQTVNGSTKETAEDTYLDGEEENVNNCASKSSDEMKNDNFKDLLNDNINKLISDGEIDPEEINILPWKRLDDKNNGYPVHAKKEVPGAPTEVSAATGDEQVTVSFTAPEDNGGAEITEYTVISSPGSITETGTSSPIIVTGLTNGTEYTFTVKATNSVGDSNESEPSNAVTPQEIDPNVRHALKEGNVFLGGKYIELGISPMGYFGTTVAAPERFHPVGYGNKLGMQVDGDGFDNGNEPTTGDFFLPGSPMEGFGLGYKLTEEGEAIICKNYNGSGLQGITDISNVDTSSGNTLKAITTGTTSDGKLKIIQEISFEVNDKAFRNKVIVENLSEEILYDVRYTRSVDPDQDADKNNNYDTKNSVIKNPPSDDTAVVIAKGAVTDEPFVYMAKDSNARAAIAPAYILDPYSIMLWVEDGNDLLKEESTADTGIHLTFKIGDIPAGETKTVTMYNSLNPSLDEALDDLGVEEKSSNANLSALNLNDKELTPEFTSDTTSYTVSVDYNTSSIKITPTSEDENATIKVNGTGVNSGNKSDDISLSYGKNTITIVVTAQDGTTTKTYILEVSRNNPPSHKSKHKSKSTPGATVIVNGVSETAGTSKEKRVDGLLVAEIDVNEKVLNDKIDDILKQKKSTDNTDNIVEVPVTAKDADKLTVEFTGDVVKKMDDNEFKLSVQTDNIDYIVPAKEIDIKNVAELLDVNKKDLEDIELDIKIDKVDKKLTKEIMKNAKAQDCEIIFPPVEFTIVAKTSKKEIKISKFSNYVNRVMEIPAGVDHTKITTGIVYNKDGTFSHVPTEVFKKNSKYYAKLNSLTNSSYSIIWNPITVASVEKHWSKDYVNDMASRLVVKNPETFTPDAYITRGDFAEYITKALGLYRTGVAEEGKFKDVKVNDELADAITIATEYGIINGYPDKTFKPDAKITREEAMVMYARAMDIVKLDKIDNHKITIYKDKTQVSDWAYEFVKKTVGANVFNGRTKDTIVPKGTLTYAEAATAIRNLLIESGLIND